jgi:predicted molibdopterin-dependent oxidoreductase YjgC
MPTPRFVRLAERDRRQLAFRIDGRPATALDGDTVLTAMLTVGRDLREAEFHPGTRAGFCLMGACQDCWVWTEGGGRLRACSTPLAAGMSLLTRAPDAWP